MTENSSEQLVDILEDAPADPVELSPKMQVANNQEESKEVHEASFKKYTNEDDYKMISLVNHYPSGGHGGESFWNLMVKVYGNTLLEGRNGSGLRSRWRKFSKDHSNLVEYKEQLIATLPSELIQDIEAKISSGITDTSKLELNSKAYATLFPNAPKPIEAAERRVRKKKLEGGDVELIYDEEKKRTHKSTSKMVIDLNLMARKGPSILEKGVNSIETANKLELTKNFVMVRDVKEGRLMIRDLRKAGAMEGIQSCEKFDQTRQHFFKTTKGRVLPWTELEDMILQHPEYIEMYEQLIKSRTENEIKKRKSLFGLK